MMADRALEAINVQPKNEHSNVPTSTREQHLDKDGEVIIEELFPSAVVTNIVTTQPPFHGIVVPYYGAGPSSKGCSLPCALPSLELECCELPHWHVYLTRRGLNVVYKTSLFLRLLCFSSYSKQLALTDIEDIQTIGEVVSAGYQKRGSKMAPPTMIVMEIKPDRAKEFFPFCYRCCSLPTVMTIFCTEDTRDFVKAVKQQMNTMARE